MARHGFDQIPFNLGQGAELPMNYALASKLASELALYRQTLLILLTGFSEFALIDQYIGEFGMEQTSLPFDLIALIQFLRDSDALSVLGFGKIGTTAGFVAAAKASQRHSEFVAGLVSEGLADVRKDLGGFSNLAGIEQLLAQVGLRQKPGFRAFLAAGLFGAAGERSGFAGHAEGSEESVDRVHKIDGVGIAGS